jgi:subtilisin family serine protease
VIRHAWPDYVLFAQVDRSAPTVKVDAARRPFNANGSGIVWASSTPASTPPHGHFSQLELAREGASRRTSCRGPGVSTGLLAAGATEHPVPGRRPDSPLTDEVGHGTHVAGIIAGRLPEGSKPVVADSMEPVDGGFVRRTNVGPLAGMAKSASWSASRSSGRSMARQ